jgi:hypothetical protein
MIGSNLKLKILEIIKKHKHEILKDKDWWYGLRAYDINIYEDENKEKIFNIVIYKMNEKGEFNYNQWQNLKSLTENEILNM